MIDGAAIPPIDALLARREWVRRLARSLARDDAAADDLAQDAWLAALEHPPRHVDAPAGWLRRVLVRRAIDVSVEERRRAGREAAASRQRTSPATDDVVVVAEAHRRVVEAVMSLEEPYRTTVLLRFFENLPPRDVAARMNAPVETVRARVRRAVERLRAQLDEEHGGRRAAWVVPLLGAGPAAKTPAASGLARTGAAAMSGARRVGIAVVVLALLAGGAVLAFSHRPDEPGEDGPAPAPVSDDAKQPTSSKRARPSRRDRAPTSEAPASPVCAAAATSTTEPPVRVRVVNTAGAPVARVGVHLRSGRSQSVGATADDGTVQFDAVRRPCHVWAEDRTVEGVGYGVAEEFELLPGSRREVVITLGRRALLCGKVVDAEGRPLPDMEIECVEHGTRQRRIVSGSLIPFTTTTRADGGFGFALPQGVTWDVVCWTRAKATADAVPTVVGTTLDVAAGRSDIVVTARPAGDAARLVVRAVTASGRPLAGVAIRVVPPYAFAKRELGAATTDSDGRAEFAAVLGGLVGVHVVAPSFARAAWESEGWIAPPATRIVSVGAEPVVLEFVAGRPVPGRIAFPDGFPGTVNPSNPANRVMLRVLEGSTEVSSTWSDDDGRFIALVPVKAAGPFRVVVQVRNSADGGDYQGEADDVQPGREEVVVGVAKVN